MKRKDIHNRFWLLLQAEGRKRGLRTANQMADSLGFPRSTFHRWLRYELPTWTNLARIAKVTGDVRYLTLRDPPKRREPFLGGSEGLPPAGSTNLFTGERL